MLRLVTCSITTSINNRNRLTTTQVESNRTVDLQLRSYTPIRYPYSPTNNPFTDHSKLTQPSMVHELQTQNLLTLAESIFCSSDDANVAKLRCVLRRRNEYGVFRFAKAVLLLPTFARIDQELVRSVFFEQLTMEQLKAMCGFGK